MVPQLITTGEWQPVELPPHLNNKVVRERLRRASVVKGGEALQVRGNTLRAAGFVGLVSTKDVQIQILPKIYGNTLDVAGGLALTKRLMHSEFFEGTLGSGAFTSATNDQMPEFLAGALLQQVAELLRYVPPRRYSQQKDVSGTIRGKININYLSRMSAGSALRIEVTYAPLKDDNDLSRLCKAVATALKSWTSNPSHLRKIVEIRYALSGVKDVPLSLDLIRKTHLTRYEEPWDWLLVVAELLLQGRRTSLVEGGSFNGLSLAFPVQLLFERQLRQSLRRGFARTSTSFSRTTSLGTLYRNLAGESFQKLRPDFVLNTSGGGVIIGDAKWKHLGKSGRPMPTREDMFQMVTYLTHAGCRKGFFIYPSSEPLSDLIKTEYLRLPSLNAEVLMVGIDAMRLVADGQAKQAEIDTALANALQTALAASAGPTS